MRLLSGFGCAFGGSVRGAGVRLSLRACVETGKEETGSGGLTLTSFRAIFNIFLFTVIYVLFIITFGTAFAWPSPSHLEPYTRNGAGGGGGEGGRRGRGPAG